MTLLHLPFLLLIAVATPLASLAQPPISRGEQLLAISYDEAYRRARSALQAEGYVNLREGGAHIIAFKQEHSAVIMCNVAPEGKVWINVVVASYSNDAGIPGGERVRLLDRMGRAASVTSQSEGCGLGSVWAGTESGYDLTWTRRGNSAIFDVSGFINGNNFSAEQTIEIVGNKVNINRYKAIDGNTCRFEGLIQSNGKNVRGTYTCDKYKPTGDWKAVINCN
ncbi:hypothetical protein [Spirosoma endbachense]|uniref:hypothetical protein n=1 Tax=Spirosoma endbachense TaxID=2666025 RepID=UPI0013919AC9|nr:hypothetical protein [Spirosoma endbachense]